MSPFFISTPAILLNVGGAIRAACGLDRDGSAATRAILGARGRRGFFTLQAVDGAYQKEYGKSHNGKTHHGVDQKTVNELPRAKSAGYQNSVS